MSGISIKIDDTTIMATLSRIRLHLGDMTPALHDIGEIVKSSVKHNFSAQGRPKKWPASKRARDEGGQTLSDTARLRNSFTVAVSNNSVAVGTNVVYARVHHFGAKKGSFGTFPVTVKAHKRKGSPVKAHQRSVKLPWGNIPARPFMMLQDEDKVEINAVLNDYLLGDIKN